MSARRTISNGAAALLAELAEREGVSERAYLEALLHYAGSIERRPGSWEAAQPFAFASYDDRTERGRCADRWFDDARAKAAGARAPKSRRLPKVQPRPAPTGKQRQATARPKRKRLRLSRELIKARGGKRGR